MFGGDVELDAYIDVLVTPQRMRLILLPTPRHADHRRGHRRGFPVRARRNQHRGAPAEQRRPSVQGWVTYYLAKRRHWELALTRLKVFLEKGLDQEQPTPRY